MFSTKVGTGLTRTLPFLVAKPKLLSFLNLALDFTTLVFSTHLSNYTYKDQNLGIY